MNNLEKHVEEFKASIAPFYQKKDELKANSLIDLRKSVLIEIDELMIQKEIFLKEHEMLKKIAQEQINNLYDLLINSFPELSKHFEKRVSGLLIVDHSGNIMLYFVIKDYRVDYDLEITQYSIPEKPWKYKEAFYTIEELFEVKSFKETIVRNYKKLRYVAEKQK